MHDHKYVNGRCSCGEKYNSVKARPIIQELVTVQERASAVEEMLNPTPDWTADNWNTNFFNEYIKQHRFKPFIGVGHGKKEDSFSIVKAIKGRTAQVFIDDPIGEDKKPKPR